MKENVVLTGRWQSSMGGGNLHNGLRAATNTRNRQDSLPGTRLAPELPPLGQVDRSHDNDRDLSVTSDKNEEAFRKGHQKHAHHQGDAHDGRTHARRAEVAGGLEELLERQSLRTFLQPVAPYLIERRRDDAGEPDRDPEEESSAEEAVRRVGEQAHQQTSNETPAPAVEDVAHHCGRICLVQQGWFDGQLHALAKPVVRHRQHQRAEQPSVEDSSVRSSQGRVGEHQVDHLKNRELQHVRRERCEEESEAIRDPHRVEGLLDSASMHQKTVHDRFGEC
mmetsp:Transcript_27765/g.60713  ORF Transcript_27765/g.60713 Transcript_27765/m.60713 type:complete len:279 (+) Transcript_27765:135-971(+)